MIGWLGFVVVVLATYRATRIVTTDSITDRARDRLYAWAWVEPIDVEDYAAAARRARSRGFAPADNAPLPRGGGLRTYVNELFNCPWCFGVWVAYAFTAAWCWLVLDGVSVVEYLFIGLAVAGAQGFIASRYDA